MDAEERERLQSEAREDKESFERQSIIRPVPDSTYELETPVLYVEPPIRQRPIGRRRSRSF